MANLDSTTNVFIHSVTSIPFEDGATPTAATLTMHLREGFAGWTQTPRTVVEARNAGRHLATPIVNETTDNNCSGSFQGLVSSWKSNSTLTPEEFLTNTGGGGALTSTATGTAFCFKMINTFTADDGSTQQTATFAFCHIDTLDITEVEGQYAITFNWTAYQNRPAFA